MYIPRPIYPHAGPHRRPTEAGLHDTGGLPGNVALDFMAPGGTLILAPQDCHITQLSGHDPVLGTFRDGKPNARGDIFGWSTYMTVPDGWYFLTHQSKRFVHFGQWVRKGTPIGIVGHWPHDEGRSHSHLGFTHKNGHAASTKRILNCANGPFRTDPRV